MHPTVFIGLDGATFYILDLLTKNGTMPFLNQFVKDGVRAPLLSTPNPLTPPAWISSITGRNPGSHGIFDFIWAEERENEIYFTLYNFRDIQCETIWSIVSRQQGSICSLNFPMMSPPPDINGYVVPGLVSWKHLRRNVHPANFYEKLKVLPGFNSRELAWDFQMEKKASKGVPADEYKSWIDFHIRRERQWYEIVQYIMQSTPCDLTSIIFDGPDKISHIGWRFLDPQCYPDNPTKWEQKILDLCLEYFYQIDTFLAKIANLAGSDARIFIISDHGFGPSRYVFRVNTWLHEHGYLNWKASDGLDEKNQRSIKRLIENHFVYLDWNTTTAYARTTTSNGIYIRVANKRGQTGVPIDKYESFRSNLIDELLAITHPETGELVVKRVLTKEEAYPGENNQQAPDLTLVMGDNGFVSILHKTPVVCPRPEIEGTHYPQGIFIANGPGIQKGLTLSPFSITDVAPCLLYSLGLDIPSDFEGDLPVEIFEDSFIKSNPYSIGRPTQGPDSYAFRAQRGADNRAEDEEIYERLKMLGYIE
ncbi:MAG: alkaline phosphatase family protein [Planctomycetota bacterium]|jgi:predicted AlkP superfamily phosphohydrolase/phosphomutase